MYEDSIIMDAAKRDELADRFEVLEKVKALLLVDALDMATVKQVANFYEVSEDAIKKVSSRHMDELKQDGLTTAKVNDFRKGHLVPTNRKIRGAVEFYINGSETQTVSNAKGLRMFPRRAILRIGMLLRDSKVAAEVRTQLLNIEEKANAETKVADINDEQELLLGIAKAYASGNATDMLIATQALDQFRQRHIKALEETNDGLRLNNKMLAREALEWDDRAKINAGIRHLCQSMNLGYANVWNELYKELKYKHHIDLKQRGNSPYLNHINGNEWEKVFQSFAAMCEARGTTAAEMINQIEMDKVQVAR